MFEKDIKKLSRPIIIIALFLLYTIYIPTSGIDSYLKNVIDVLFFIGLIFVYRQEFKDGIKDIKKKPLKFILFIIGFWLISIVVTTIINQGIKEFFNVYAPNNDAQKCLFDTAPFYLGASMLLFSPVVEELCMTVSFHKIIKNKWLYLIISSLFCGMLYIVFSPTSISYVFIVSYTAQSLVWTYAYLKTKNIFTPILIHFLQNILVLIGYVLLTAV